MPNRFPGSRKILVGAICLVAGAGLAPAGVLAQDASLEGLRAQLERLQARIDQLERDRQTAARAVDTSNVVTGGDLPGSFKLPGSETSIQFGGYMKLDLIYDRDQDQGDTLFDNALRFGASSDSSFRAHARQSRLFMKTLTPTQLGDLRTHLELDFFGAGGNEIFSNSRNFRIRHAYGELGGLLAGQTWSNFMHFAAYPSTVDFNGPVGVSFLRQAQLRYTLPVGPGKLSVALENPEATGFADSRDSAPDFTARYSWSGERAAVETGAVLRRLTVDGAAGDDDEFGYGLMLAGNVRVAEATKLMGGVIWGDGIGRYLFLANGSADGSSGIGSAFLTADGKLKTIKARGFNVAIERTWSRQLTSSLSYGRASGDRPSALFPTSTDRLETIHFSNFYKPIDPVTLGFEISRAAQKLQDGRSEHALRFQASAQYNF